MIAFSPRAIAISPAGGAFWWRKTESGGYAGEGGKQAEQLGMAIGMEVVALVKASAVLLLTDEGLRTSARNQLWGTVERVVDGPVNAEVILSLGGGKTVTAVYGVPLPEAKLKDLAGEQRLQMGAHGRALELDQAVVVDQPIRRDAGGQVLVLEKVDFLDDVPGVRLVQHAGDGLELFAALGVLVRVAGLGL